MPQQTALRRPGRPQGTVKRYSPKIRIRVGLEPHTIEAINRHAKASGLEVGPWLDFTIADLESGGRLLNERREQDLKFRQMQRFTTAVAALLHCRSTEQFLEVARLATRVHQKK
jgi:hypothetical protein